MTIIEQLNKLAGIAPEMCKYDGNVYTLSGYHFWMSRDDLFSAGIVETYLQVVGHPALDWLEGALRQVIEARGWEYTLCKFSHNYFIEIWSDEVVFESQATSATEALLAALIKAMGG